MACVFGGRVRAFLAPLHRHAEIVLEHSSHVRCLGRRGSFRVATGYEHRPADEGHEGFHAVRSEPASFDTGG